MDERSYGEATDSEDPVRVDMRLVDRVRRGDLEAYGELVHRHMRRAFSIAYGILRNRQDAEDVVQEAFIRTLESIDRIEPGRPFHPWFNRIVANRAISYGRSRVIREGDVIPTTLRSTEPPPDRAVEHRELRERLTEAVDALPEVQRTVVVLSDVEDMSSAEISEMLEMPAGTVRYHLHLARRTLRERLGEDIEEAR